MPLSIGVFRDYEAIESDYENELSLPHYYDPLDECFLSRLQAHKWTLTHLRIPSFCCQRLTYFELDDYVALKTVFIGYNSFFPSFAFSLPESTTLTSPVRITNCPKLEDIDMEGWSFALSSGLILNSAY